MRGFAKVLLVCVAICGCMLVGCSGAADVKSQWVGTWDLDSVEGGEQSLTSQQMSALRALGLSYNLTLNEDGTATMVSSDGSSASGTWEAKSASTATVDLGATPTEFTRDGDTITTESNGAKVVFARSKDASASAAAASSGTAANASSASAASSSSAAAQAQTKKEPTLGSTIEFDDLSITFGDSIATTTIDNQFSDHYGETIIAVPVTITNNASKAKGLNMFAVKVFGSQGTELDTVYTYFDDDARMAGDMRPGVSMSANLYFPYDGNGDYFLDFGFYSTEVEVKIPIAL